MQVSSFAYLIDNMKSHWDKRRREFFHCGKSSSPSLHTRWGNQSIDTWKISQFQWISTHHANDTHVLFHFHRFRWFSENWFRCLSTFSTSLRDFSSSRVKIAIRCLYLKKLTFKAAMPNVCQSWPVVTILDFSSKSAKLNRKSINKQFS